ncbi:MAG TPA: hypothetical protein VHA78_01295, partial [Candidatus Peribacteraceae bacterium]|nr:hypothetical protein [Candidatus Peribacteraceae bacterium]
ELGIAIAKKNALLVFGVEHNQDHLPDIAYEGLASVGGTALGIFRTKEEMVSSPYMNVIPVVTGMQRGAGWEAVIVLSSQVLIVVGGRAGTMQEVAIAYQAGIPVIVINGSGGFSDLLTSSDNFLQFKKGQHMFVVQSASEAVDLAIQLARHE